MGAKIISMNLLLLFALLLIFAAYVVKKSSLNAKKLIEMNKKEELACFETKGVDRFIVVLDLFLGSSFTMF